MPNQSNNGNANSSNTTTNSGADKSSNQGSGRRRRKQQHSSNNKSGSKTTNNTANDEKKKKKKQQQQERQQQDRTDSSTACQKHTLLALHGNRQTGQLFLGRLEKLRKKLSKPMSISTSPASSHSSSSTTKTTPNSIMLETIAPDAPFPHPEDSKLCTWWNRVENDYVGLETTLKLLWDVNRQYVSNVNNNSKDTNDATNSSSTPSASASNSIVGLIGFSQGARLAHLISLLHNEQPNVWFPHLKFVIIVAGYDAPTPDRFSSHISFSDNDDDDNDNDDNDTNNRTTTTTEENKTIINNDMQKAEGEQEDNRHDGNTQRSQLICLPSLHVYGLADPLVTPDQSKASLIYYQSPQTFEHGGKHYVPSKGPDLQIFVNFIQQSLSSFDSVSPPSSASSAPSAPSASTSPKAENIVSESLPSSSSSQQEPEQQQERKQEAIDENKEVSRIQQKPDEESAAMQQEEIQALEAIFPEEFSLISKSVPNIDEENDEGIINYEHPICYQMKLLPSDENAIDDNSINNNNNTHWPPHPLTLQVSYPYNYPIEVIPTFQLIHENNSVEFPSSYVHQILKILNETSTLEVGMPSILSCMYALKDYLDSPLTDEEKNAAAAARRNHSDNKNKNSVAGNATNDDNNDNGDDDVVDDNDNNNATSNLIDDQDESSRKYIDIGNGVLIKRSSVNEIQKCNLEGLVIAEKLLSQMKNTNPASNKNKEQDAAKTSGKGNSGSSGSNSVGFGGGGSYWTYTIGLVGKPSAGKSTFFNAATAFSRQRGEKASTDNTNNSNNNDPKSPSSSSSSTNTHSDANTNEWGGASMAAHPFTTIDPNIGYCLVPAPEGSCPEDDIQKNTSSTMFASTHGRDSQGRRFLPVLLKDVAGLVPGAYQGRGRGNQFLNDLCDSTVLIHVVDASGTADAQGNKTVVDEPISSSSSSNNNKTKGNMDDFEYITNPLEDLAWIRNELVEWVNSNILAKWGVISRKGKDKLTGMFSGYGQREAVTHWIFSAVEKFLEETYQRDRALDKIVHQEWDQGDVHRLVSTFLGVRFPMALALNKVDLPSSVKHVATIQTSLPIHGAYVATPMVARQEMNFVRRHLSYDGKQQQKPTKQKQQQIIDKGNDNIKKKETTNKRNATTIDTDAVVPPNQVWQCLTSAMELREPVLVFPVSDMQTYAPMPGLNKTAVGHPSLPSQGMINCIRAAGGRSPTCWNDDKANYTVTTTGASSSSSTNDNNNNNNINSNKLRDVLMMKPGSTVEDVFLTLKRLGAISGEFVRAEAAGSIGEKPKPIPKHEMIGKKSRIIKIMSNKRTTWQS